MNESIELNTFTTKNAVENDIQEYHEITQDTTLDDVDTSFTFKQSPKVISDFGFFTQQDVNTKSKQSMKKKKIKKKEKSSNLMDTIKSQIAAVSVPITENVITFIDNSKEHQSSYLRTSFRTNYKKSRHIFDAENGLHRHISAIHLSPIFPKVLENAITDDTCFPVEYMYPTSFNEIAAAKSAIDEDTPAKFLDVSIQNITFKHHHSYSLEKLLSLKVVEIYKQYEHVQKSLKVISKDIKISRQTKNNLKDDLLKVSSSKKESIRFDETVRKYTAKLIQLKEKQRELFKTKKELTHKIITLWSDVEMVREKNKCVETPYKLELTKRFLDNNQFEKEWKENFDLEFMDKLDDIEYQYVNEYLQYKKAKNEQKENIGKKLNKPQLQIDEDAIKELAQELANKNTSKDEIELELKRDDSIVTNFGAIFTKHSYHFELYVDEIFVCESEHYLSNDMIKIEFTESFSVQILAKNVFIIIALLEDGNIASRIKINLADVKKAISTAEFKVENFIYDNDIVPNAKEVGSGHSIKEIAIANKARLRSSNLFKGNLYSNCEIYLKVGWNDKIEHNRSEAIKYSFNIGRQIKRLLNGTDNCTLNVLINIISEIYGKDIDDENMIETLEKLCNLEVTNDDSFLIDDSDLTRLKLLHLRNIGGFSNIEKKLIPVHASQISTEQLNCLQKKDEKEFDMDYLNDREMDLDPIELQRFIGQKYIQKLNKNMLTNLNEFLLQKTHKDVVTEFNFTLRNLFSKHFNVANSATLSNSTKQQILSESIAKEQEIHVTVLRAFNLLDRSSSSLEEADDEADKIAGFKTRSLRPFVRINYKGVSAETVTAIGSHPTWSHTLKIKSKLEPLSSLQINVFDEYKAQILNGFSEDDRSNRTVHYRLCNKWLGTLLIPMYTVLSMGSLRGTFKITTPPFLFGYETLNNKECISLIPEISQLMKKDTSFITLEVTTSLSHLGGLHVYSQPLPCSIEDDYLIKHLNNFVTEYVNQFPMRNISLTFIDSAGRNKCVTQFLQPIPLPEKDLFPKTPRSESAISKSSGLSKSSSSSGRQRDLDRERVTQEDRESLYSGTIPEADNLTKMINACMRYVSLIPSYEVIESHVVTLFGIELLKILHGSPLDHTIILASYFIGLGIKCWVAIGFGLPRGPSNYVLIKYDLSNRRIVLENESLFRSRGFLNKSDGYSWIVCDAVSGQRYELRDVGCPLKTVDYVFDNENIWVNMQVSQDCENMSFDFSRSSEWQPVFDKTVFVMKQQLVTDPSLYSPPPNVEGLRVMLESKIKTKIQKWRPHLKTIWNRYCSTLLREMLPQWEYWAFNPTGTKPGFSQRMKQLMVTYKIFGFPLNMSYINTKSVKSTVKSTGLHMTDDPVVEFALAVEVYPYPNNVISVWVFLATITRL